MGLLVRFRSSLTYPIAATLVLVTVVPVVLVGWRLAAYNRENLETIEKQYLTRQAVSLAKEVSLFFSSHRIQLTSTVSALQAGNQVAEEAYTTLLQGLAQEGQSFVYLRIINTRGQGSFVRAPTVDEDTEQALNRFLSEPHDQALAGHDVQQYNVRVPGWQAAAAVFAYPLRSRRGTTWGVLEGVLDYGPLQQRMMDDAYSGLRVSIIDGEGTVVVSSQPSLRGRPLAESPLVGDFLRSALRLTRVYTPPTQPSVGKVLGSVAPVEGMDWGVVVERPVAEAFTTVRVMQERTLLVTAVAALIALGVGFALSRRLIRPLQSLAGTTSEIADGNFAVRASIAGTDELAQLAGNFNDMAFNIEALVRRLKQALRQNQELFLETIRTLAAAIDAKDPYTRGHSERVSSYSMAIARHLDLSPEEVFRIRIAAILHDVGKLGIRDGILNKPGGLTEEEYAIMKRHTDIGAQIMSPIRTLRDIIPGIRNHHESYDGRGYPDRLEGDEIPLVARIIGAADTFDAMTTNRPTRTP
jgi:putative nucleotidyltransferase with HDIG domain